MHQPIRLIQTHLAKPQPLAKQGTHEEPSISKNEYFKKNSIDNRPLTSSETTQRSPSFNAQTYRTPYLPLSPNLYQLTQQINAQIAPLPERTENTGPSSFDGVINSAQKFNGKCTWPFSQGFSLIDELIAKDKHSAGGICEMLAATWIEQKARGSSLERYLQDYSGNIDPNKIRQIQQLFIAGITLNPGAMVEDKNSLGGISYPMALRMLRDALVAHNRLDHFLYSDQLLNIQNKTRLNPKKRLQIISEEFKKLETEISVDQKKFLRKWMASQHMKTHIPYQSNATATWLKAKNIESFPSTHRKMRLENDSDPIGNQQKQMHFYHQMGDDIVNSIAGGRSHAYQLIGMNSPQGGHRMTAYMGPKGIDFFDPNFGEFHFNQKEDFIKWWPTFLTKSGYAKDGYDAYALTTCRRPPTETSL